MGRRTGLSGDRDGREAALLLYPARIGAAEIGMNDALSMRASPSAAWAGTYARPPCRGIFYQREFQFTSSGLLILLGLWLATKAMRQPVPKAGAAQQATRPPGLVQLYLLTLANPLTILLFAGFSGQMTAGGGLGAIVTGSVFLFLGSLAIQAGYATFGAVLQRWVTTPRAVRAVNALSGVAIAGFGLYGLWRAG